MSTCPTAIDDLHLLLLPRIDELRKFVASQIHARFQALISPDDILQEVWINAYRAAAELRSRDPRGVDAWLHTVARSRVLDALRIARQARHGGRMCRNPQLAGNLRSCTDLFDRLRGPCPTPSQELHQVETGHLVSMVLNLIPEDRRRAVSLRYLDGRPLDEVGRLMNRTPQAVNSLLFHGLRQLRDLLGPAAAYFSDARSSESPNAPRRSPERSLAAVGPTTGGDTTHHGSRG